MSATLDGSDCMYCEAALTLRNPLSHVVPNAMGGRLQRRDIDCGTCNRETGKIEEKFVQQFHHFAAGIGAIRGDGSTTPGRTYEVPGRGEMTMFGGVLHPPPAVERRRDDGKVERMFTGCPERVAENIMQVGLRNRLSLIGLEASMGHSSEKGGPVEDAGRLEFRFGGEAEERAVTKILLNLVAHRAPALARSPELESARLFARYGSISGPDSLGMTLDPVCQPPFLVAALAAPFSHLVEVWSFAGRVCGRLVVFGHFQYSVEIARRWTGTPFRVAYAVDPLGDQSDVVSFDTDEHGVCPEWWSGRRRASREEVRLLADVAMAAFRVFMAPRIRARMDELRTAEDRISTDEFIAQVLAIVRRDYPIRLARVLKRTSRKV